ncbi:taurine transport system substrate-binding protein [Sulfitobacter brevis]|uniref:Taurine transport system substrate-binding protein n=2 Tax=Sulfitobacter brevis TaxID=74348 RepID=A0A1I1W5T7_9RHOB|nr:taurine transport system substrate-binding protein [Sulfitobacter brevis]
MIDFSTMMLKRQSQTNAEPKTPKRNSGAQIGAKSTQKTKDAASKDRKFIRENKMFKETTSSLVAGAVMALSGQAAFADAHGEITVGYFLEWPMPFQYAKVNGTYDEELGTKVNWVSFDSGTAMSAAMASGDVQISVSQGIPPFVVATSAGQDLQVVDVAVSYSENDNCVVSSGLEIDKDSASELAGKKVAVPLGTAAHYGFLKQMDHFGVDVGSMTVVDMAPAEGAAALSQGSVDMACGWGGALRRMKESGNILLTGAEKEELGILVFDATTAPASFVAENSDIVAKFIKVTADANAMWASGEKTDEMLEVIAKDSGMDVEATKETLATFAFPTIDDQLADKWLGGGSQKFMGGVAQVFVDAGSIDSALDSYDGTVNTGPLKAAQGM